MALSNASKEPVTAKPSNCANVGLCTRRYDATVLKSVRTFSNAPFLNSARASAYSPTLAKVCALRNSSSARFNRVCTAPPSISSLLCFFRRAARTASLAARAGDGDPTRTPETTETTDEDTPTSPKHADLRVVRARASPAVFVRARASLASRSAVLALCSSSFARARAATARNERPSRRWRGRADRGRRGEGRHRATRPLAGGHAAAWRRLVGVSVNIASGRRGPRGDRARACGGGGAERGASSTGAGDVSLGRHRLTKFSRRSLAGRETFRALREGAAVGRGRRFPAWLPDPRAEARARRARCASRSRDAAGTLGGGRAWDVITRSGMCPASSPRRHPPGERAAGRGRRRGDTGGSRRTERPPTFVKRRATKLRGLRRRAADETRNPARPRA